MIDLGIVPDRLDDTIAAVRRARDAGADVLVTSGGASVGDYDLVQKALAAEGLALSFWKVALRPGRPMMHGRLGAMHVLGLPGNPVSAYRLRGPVPGAADPPARRPDATSSREPNRPCSAATCRPTTSAPITCAPRLTRRTGRSLVATPFPMQDSSRCWRRSQRPIALWFASRIAPAASAGSRCAILKLTAVLAVPRLVHLKLKWLRNTYGTYSVCS